MKQFKLIQTKMKFPKCKLARIINPGNYWVVSTEELHVEEVKSCEEKMERENCFDVSSKFKLNCQMCVAVIDSHGKFKRGIIEEQITHNLYKIFLLDYGTVVQKYRSQIYIITDESLLKIEPLTFNVKLYGLIPLAKGDKKFRASGWTTEAELFVQNLLKNIKEILVENVLIEQRTVFGDIFIKAIPGANFVSLREILCKNNLCVYSEVQFLEQEDLCFVNQNEDLETKMELVRKWQKENFSDFGNFTSDSNSINPNSYSDCSKTKKSNLTPLNSNSVEPKPFGMGRGKIKQLLYEMKTIQKAAFESSSETSSSYKSITNSEECSPCTTMTRGRGHLLTKYLQLKNTLNKENKNSIKSSFTLENVRKPGFSDFALPNELSAKKEYPSLVRKLWALHGGSNNFSNSSNLTDSLKRNSDQTSPDSFYSADSDEEKLSKSSGKSSSLIQSSRLIRKTHLWTPYVFFEDCVVEPVKTFRELPIQASIIKNLERRGFHELSQIQRWAIPSIRKQHNTIVIGSSKTGKTVSYVVYLVDYIQDQSYFEELPQGNGPYVVIVASSSRVCESIYYFCQSLLAQNPKRELFKIVMAYGSNCTKEVWIKLTNGCDILISTPHCLNRLLETPVLTNFERLSCLVLDDFDVLSSNPFRKNVQIILQKARLCSQNRHYQIILCGEKWTPNVSSLVKKFVNPYALIIGSYSEAVIYEGIIPQIFLVDRSQKPKFLLSKIKDRIGRTKILVVCERAAEACELYKFFKGQNISSVLAHENMMAESLKETKRTWLSSLDTVLVITDGVLPESNIREAQTLVHYSLPTTSKTNFYLRYSTLENFLRVKQNSTQNQNHWCDIILVDDENHYQLPPIVDFVSRLGGIVSPKVLEKSEEIQRAIEIEKKAPLCENLLAFGRCRNWKNCPRRHALAKDLDSPKVDFTKNSWVNFVVASVHNASSFSVWLTKEDANKAKNITKRLSEFYGSEANQKPLGNPKIGRFGAVVNDNIFHRVKIIETLKVDAHGKPLEVVVKFIDEGSVQMKKVTELYELPENQHQPGTVVDVIIIGVQPVDFDESWSENANDLVKNLLSQNLEPDHYWSGRVVLVLGDILFLDSVKRKQFLSSVNLHVFDLVVQDELLSKAVAESNKEHLQVLEKLCEEAGIDVAAIADKLDKVLTAVEPQWAFFDSDFVKVRFCAAENTSTVFVQPEALEKLLSDLEDLCQIEAEKLLNERKEGKDSTTIGVGMFCLAKCENGKWNRGRIESETDTNLDVYFVDHGDVVSVSKENVTSIPESLLLRLPFQAIECSLAGIKHENNCPLEVLKEIYWFSEDGTEDLFASIVSKDLKPSMTKGRKYSVCLYNKRGVSLNKMLVDSNMVQLEESEKEHLKNIEMEETTSNEGGEASDDEEEKTEEKVDENKNNEMLKLTSMKDYCINFKDELFQDQEGLEFLKEFASKVFPSLAPPPKRNSPETVKALESSPNQPTVKTLSPTKVSPHLQRLMDLHKNRRRRNESSLELKIRDNVFTPRVLWCQNQVEIRMKIQLENVIDYSLECDVSNLSFRCFHNGKFYAVDLKLYGAVNPQLTKVTVKAWHVVVTLTKLASPSWPRLHADEEKHRWINLDVESLLDKDEEFFASKIKAAKLAIEKGEITKKVKNEKIVPVSDSEFSYESELDNLISAEELDLD